MHSHLSLSFSRGRGGRPRAHKHIGRNTTFSSSMGLQGYVGSAGDADRVRAGEARRAAERAAAAETKRAIEAKHATGLRQFGAGASEVREEMCSTGPVRV
jgi:hypothetical protein